MERAWVVVDLGFGDSGKGTITDFLVRDQGAGLVVRYNGGAQAGHNVVTTGGRHHTFSQFGSGLFVDDCHTHLGEQMVLHPGGMAVEAERLAAVGIDQPYARTTVDANILVISPFHQAAGRLREMLRGDKAHGSCGVGVGEAVGDALDSPDDAIRARNLRDFGLLAKRLSAHQQRAKDQLDEASDLDHPAARPEWDLLVDREAVSRVIDSWASVVPPLDVVDGDAARARIHDFDSVVFEGAHGVLIDETWGFHPHTTWNDCTTAGAEPWLGASTAEVTRIGVVRAYSTRHGAGPFPSHDAEHTEAHPEAHNPDDGWQGSFRTGPLDLVMLRYALQVAGGVDGLALTCLDRVGPTVPVCIGYTGPPVSPELAVCDPEGRIFWLRPGEADDLEHRRRLGQFLAEVEPVVVEMPVEQLIPAVGQALGAPVVITSSGPTAADKQWWDIETP
jgi:adenylosuccinate synthase